DESLEPRPLFDVPDPRLLAPDLPDDLCDLAVDLLQRRAEARPTGAAILTALGAPIPAPCAALAAWEARFPFVAREAEIASLDDALAEARRGATVTMHLHGNAGMGKSALVRRFLDRLAERGEALVIEGPCLQGSPRPHEGFAGVIEALATHLRALPDAQVERLLPRDAALLLRLFPVLASVAAIAAAPRFPEAPDPREQHRRAAAALRALLVALAALGPLVIAVDGFEHGSDDGAALLADLLELGEHPHEIAPPLLLIVAYRSEDAAAIPLVRALRRRLTRGEVVGDVRELLVEPLSGRDARTLARLLFAAHVSADKLADLARESQGSPRMLRALAATQGAPAPAADLPAPVIDDVDAEQAGDASAAALAFHRAVACYQRALDARAAPSPALRDKLAAAFAQAGQADREAQILLASAERAEPTAALECRARAAAQLLRGGQIAEGLTLAESTLASLDLALPVTATRALASLVFRRAQLTLRGLGADDHRAAHLPKEELNRLDLGWNLARSLSPIDPVRAADLDARLLLLALRLGEPGRVARALAREAWTSAAEGGARGRERASALISRAAEIARAHGDPALIAGVNAVNAGVSHLAHRFREAAQRAEQAIPLLRDACPESGPAVALVRNRWLFPSLYLLGDLAELARRVPFCLREAEQRGALDEETTLRTGMMARAHFVMDRPIEAITDSAEALRRWSPRGFHEAHLADLFTRANGYLYEGDAPRAAADLRAAWPVLERAHLLRAESIRIEAHALRAAATAAAARWSADRETLLRMAERDARLLAKERVPLASALSLLAFAGAAVARGQRERALPLFERAEAAFEALSMRLHAAVARRRRGELLGGDGGRALVWSCDEWMITEEVRNPERMAAMLAPW
ncbi:MAG: ATP-binding protein, partial [Minicystis sp.]